MIILQLKFALGGDVIRGISLSLVVLASSAVANATSPVIRPGPYDSMSGCLDCFNFAAPTVYGSSPNWGAESIAAPEIGLIVYDAYYGMFRGFNSAGVWSKLSVEKPVRSLTSTATLLVQDEFVKVDASSAAVTINLPAAASMTGRELIIKKTDSSMNAVTIDPNSTETIDGSMTRTVSVQNELLRITSDGTNWQTSSQQNRAPTIQKFTSGAGTYYAPVGVSHIRVRMVGGGGGGAGSGSSGGTAPTSGIASTFGTSLLSAGGGSAGAWGYNGGAGGTSSLGSGSTGLALAGGAGQGAQGNAVSGTTLIGGQGGSSAFGGNGQGGALTAAGTAGAANTGGGGGGGGIGTTSSSNTGSGGGAGGFVDAIITTPAASYPYSVGSGGNAGTGGTSGYAGGAGGSGLIVIEEYYK